MAHYLFDRMSCLIVDDSNFMRSLIIGALGALGVYQVKVAEHGGDAIDLLRLMKVDPLRAGIMSVDMIISNWQMSPVDGMMLLRWIRRGADSPNRFIPFIMITAYSETERVRESRDLGVTEFLTKPFSVNTLAQKIAQTIERPRQFVHTQDYFGPDRRRNVKSFDHGERRLLKETSPGVEVVYDD
ncbi:MAG: response regulator [Alphaproteobacteria bacterium]|nr:response regulator [Alphaproteobacteria bacterium]